MLELGTGTGVGTAWLLDGMDARARLETVDEDEAVVAVARKHLGRDARVAFHVMEGAEFLRARVGHRYNLRHRRSYAAGAFSVRPTRMIERLERLKRHLHTEFERGRGVCPWYIAGSRKHRSTRG